MSLNGLDATEVNDAYQAALGEGGGWFLLKYTSRDEVGLLEKGNGGLADLQEVVNRYEEQSPVYGFIQYRRRKVVLKYLPEGTSRLLQGERTLPPAKIHLRHHAKMKTARVTVQFQSVIEKLSPHDTIFSFAQSAELRDSALSSACSLHTATASIKSSNDSLPRRGLAEITEDASESRVDTFEGRGLHRGTARDEELSTGAEDTQIVHEKVNESTSADRTHHRSTSATTQCSFRPRTTSNTDKPLPPPPPEDRTCKDTSPRATPDYGEYNTRPSMEGRFSSNSTRPSTRDLYDAYGYKKQAKVGPRPSTDSVGASKSLDSRVSESRPVSTLPAGLRMPSRKAVLARPASRQAQASPPIQASFPTRSGSPAQINSPDNMTLRRAPTTPVAPIHIPDRNVATPNNGLRSLKMPEQGSPKMTPEKQRLMKAIQLRQKQMAARNFVNGLGTKNVSEEREYTKLEIDDSILGAVIDASDPTEGSESVRIPTKDVFKEDSRHLEDSPISMPETAEGPSTQASSITDEEEAVAQKRQQNHATSIPSISEHQDLLPDQLAEDHHHHRSIGSQEAVSEDTQNNAPTKAASMESFKNSSWPSGPTQSQSCVVDKEMTEQKAAGMEFLESREPDQSTSTGGQALDEKNATAQEVDVDKQLSPNLLLEDQAPKDQSSVGDGLSLFDQRILYTAEINKNRAVQQNEPLQVHDKAHNTREVYENREGLQIQPLRNEEEVYSVLDADKFARVSQSQPGECHGQSSEHPAQSLDEISPRQAQNDIDKPLLVRRSSSSSSITAPSDNVNAHEIPLPPIDEDEEISLSPQRALFREQAATDPPFDSDGEFKAATLQAKILSQDSDHLFTRSSTSSGAGDRQTERQIPKQGANNAIKRVSSPDQSDEHFLSDESFMDELKSAKVQEAKPVSVSKSPIKPVFSRSESEQRLNESTRTSRSVSTPVEHSAKGEGSFSPPRLPSPLSATRSFSAQHAPPPNSQQSQVPISKKIGVSSSISQRIKALEQLSSRPTSPVSPNPAPNTPTFLGLRKTSLRAPSSGSDYKNSNSNKNRPGQAYPSPSPSPEPVSSSHFNHSNKIDLSGTIQSVPVAIVRDARDKSPEIPSNPPESYHQDLQQTPLQVERQKSPAPAGNQAMGLPPLSPLKPPRPRFGRYSSTRSGSSSSNEPKLEPPPTTRRDSFASVRSKSSRAGSEVELPGTLNDSSLSGVTSLDGTQDEKKDSRRSRLLKRMSSISSMSRRSIAHALSPGPKEAPIIERQEPVQEAPSTSVDVGDVNIQFPDNLLWKRRHMVIDAHGVLVLSASKSDNNSKAITKRYPISEFRPPYIPDQDRQELPNSVVLDFKDGSTLQCACEHLQSQAGVLKALRQVYSAHQS